MSTSKISTVNIIFIFEILSFLCKLKNEMKVSSLLFNSVLDILASAIQPKY